MHPKMTLLRVVRHNSELICFRFLKLDVDHALNKLHYNQGWLFP